MRNIVHESHSRYLFEDPAEPRLAQMREALALFDGDVFCYPPYWPLQTLGFSERLSGELTPLASLTSLQKIVLALCRFS